MEIEALAVSLQRNCGRATPQGDFPPGPQPENLRAFVPEGAAEAPPRGGARAGPVTAPPPGFGKEKGKAARDDARPASPFGSRSCPFAMDAPNETHNRSINYLRISITDRCNLRCRYCMPKEGVSPFGHAEVLRYEEILRIAAAAARLGIAKIRITGGEPLVRADAVRLVEKLARIPGIRDLSMTTNGVLLADFAGALREAGLQRVNISMDSLNPDKYRRITRGGDLSRVRAGIAAARKAGLTPVKINAVAIAGFNDDEIPDFARLTLAEDLQVRFIEFMPVGESCAWKPEQSLSADEVRKRIETLGPLAPLANFGNSFDGPARLFRLPGAAGVIGLISPVSDHFCASCNRLRLTSDGKLKTCLFSDEELDLKTLIRSGGGDEILEETLARAIRQKPLRQGTIIAGMKRCQRPMVKIGG
jgi:GTP 3',8-cyclase